VDVINYCPWFSVWVVCNSGEILSYIMIVEISPNTSCFALILNMIVTIVDPMLYVSCRFVHDVVRHSMHEKIVEMGVLLCIVKYLLNSGSKLGLVLHVGS